MRRGVARRGKATKARGVFTLGTSRVWWAQGFPRLHLWSLSEGKGIHPNAVSVPLPQGLAASSRPDTSARLLAGQWFYPVPRGHLRPVALSRGRAPAVGRPNPVRASRRPADKPTHQPAAHKQWPARPLARQQRTTETKRMRLGRLSSFYMFAFRLAGLASAQWQLGDLGEHVGTTLKGQRARTIKLSLELAGAAPSGLINGVQMSRL